MKTAKNLLIGLMLILSTTTMADEKSDKFDQIIKPVVRITAQTNGVDSGMGSGTIIYSDDRDVDGKFETYVLTNFHVVASSIRFEDDEFDPKLNAIRKKQIADPVKVEIFQYDQFKQSSAILTDGFVVSYSAVDDIAIVKLKIETEVPTIAEMSPGTAFSAFESIYLVGCVGGHTPLFTKGEITGTERMDGNTYIVMNAPIFFGNSGGGVFDQNEAGKWQLVGIPSRVMVKHDMVVSQVGWFIPIEGIREWIQKQNMKFLVDPTAKPSEWSNNQVPAEPVPPPVAESTDQPKEGS